MALRVTVENYRGLARADWTLEPGVSLLVGPNGSGKTTLLEVPELLQHALRKGTRTAVDAHGGTGTLVNLRVSSAEAARIVATSDACVWELELRPRGGELGISHRVLSEGNQVVLGQRPGLATL